MKNLYRNGVVSALIGCFLALNLIGEAAKAQTKNSKKPVPTPTKKLADAKAKATPTPIKKPVTAVKTNGKLSPKSAKATVNAKFDQTASKGKPDSKSKTADQKSKAANDSKSKTADQKSKKESGAASKKTKSSTSKTADNSKTKEKSLSGEQVIVVAADSRIREQPKANAAQLSSVKIGKLLPVLEKSGAWQRVQYETDKSGWISRTTTRDFNADDRDQIYQDIADKYAGSRSLDFAAAAEVYDFLRTAQALAKKDATKADLGFKRLQILARAMRAVPSGRGDAAPYKSFLQAHEKEVVYSEPSATWLVRSDLFWELHSKYMQLPIAEDIAWAAAKNTIPGECEGYINCQLYALRAMEAEYLNFYPSGRFSGQALEIVTVSLGVLVADMNDKANFTPLADISDRAEFNRFLTELRTIISKVPDAGKAKPLQYINSLGEGYK